jgi:hypothetical protein
MLLLRFLSFMGLFFGVAWSLERIRVWSFVALSRFPAYTSSTS